MLNSTDLKDDNNSDLRREGGRGRRLALVPRPRPRRGARRDRQALSTPQLARRIRTQRLHHRISGQQVEFDYRGRHQELLTMITPARRAVGGAADAAAHRRSSGAMPFAPATTTRPSPSGTSAASRRRLPTAWRCVRLRPEPHHERRSAQGDAVERTSPTFSKRTPRRSCKALISLPLATALGALLAFRPRRRGTPPRSAPVIQTQIILARRRRRRDVHRRRQPGPRLRHRRCRQPDSLPRQDRRSEGRGGDAGDAQAGTGLRRGVVRAGGVCRRLHARRAVAGRVARARAAQDVRSEGHHARTRHAARRGRSDCSGATASTTSCAAPATRSWSTRPACRWTSASIACRTPS